MNTDILVLLRIFQNMSYYFWIITWMKNANNFQIPKVQLQGVAQNLLNFFCQFQPGVAYKSVAYKKSVYVFKRWFFGFAFLGLKIQEMSVLKKYRCDFNICSTLLKYDIFFQQIISSQLIVIFEIKADNNSEYNDSGMQSFWKLKVLEDILLKSQANGKLNLIEVQFLTM